MSLIGVRLAWAVAFLFIAALLAGCEPLGPEQEIPPKEIEAAKDIRVNFRNLLPQLTAHMNNTYIHEGVLHIEGNVLNNSQRALDNVSLRVQIYDTLGRPISSDAPVFHTVPPMLQPGASAYFSIEIDATGVADVIIESVH